MEIICRMGTTTVRFIKFILVWLATTCYSAATIDKAFKKKRFESEILPKHKLSIADGRTALLKDIMISVSDDPTFVIISDIEPLIESVIHMSVDLVLYDDPALDITYEDKINGNLLYIYVLRDYQKFQPLDLMLRIRQIDPYGKILFIMTQEIEYKKFLSKKDSYHEVYFAVTLQMETCEIFEICLYCNKGKNSLQVMNEWNRKSGFKTPLKFHKSFKGSFQGGELVVSTHFIFSILEKVEDGYIGHEYFMLEFGAEKLNYKIRFNNPSKLKWGALVNGKWDGLVGKVFYKEADIAVGSVSITESRFRAVNPTYVQEFAVQVLTSIKPKRTPMWQRVFEALTPLVWACTVATVGLVGLSFYLIYLLDTKRNSVSIMYALGVAFKILCQEGISHKYPSSGAIITLSSWMLASTLIVSFYIGAMQSIILVPGYATKPISTLEDFGESSQVMKVRSGAVISNIIKSFPHLSE